MLKATAFSFSEDCLLGIWDLVTLSQLLPSASHVLGHVLQRRLC